MILTVMGATGNLGRKLLEQGVARGHTMRAVSRSISGASGLPLGVEVFEGSDATPAVFQAAFTGTDAVLVVFPPSLANPGDYPNQIARVLAAAKQFGVPRVIGLVGSAGTMTSKGIALVDSDFFGETTRHFYQGVHHAWDSYRAEKELDWVCFVPAARMQTHMLDRGEYRTRTDEHLVTTDDTSWQFFDVSQISYGDLAKAMLDEAEQPKHRWVFVTTGY